LRAQAIYGATYKLQDVKVSTLHVVHHNTHKTMQSQFYILKN